MSQTVCFFAIVGICCFAVGTPNGLVLPKRVVYHNPGTDSEISCIYHEPSLQYYYEHTISWYHRTSSSDEYGIKLTYNGFLEDPKNSKYKVAFRIVGDYGFSSNLKIHDIEDGDDGEYICALLNSSGVIINEQSMMLYIGVPTTISTSTMRQTTTLYVSSTTQSTKAMRMTDKPPTKRTTNPTPKTTSVKKSRKTVTSWEISTKKMKLESSLYESNANMAKQSIFDIFIPIFLFLYINMFMR